MNIVDSNTFDNLNGHKVSLMTQSYEVLSWIKDFFQEDRDVNSDALLQTFKSTPPSTQIISWFYKRQSIKVYIQGNYKFLSILA